MQCLNGWQTRSVGFFTCIHFQLFLLNEVDEGWVLKKTAWECNSKRKRIRVLMIIILNGDQKMDMVI